MARSDKDLLEMTESDKNSYLKLRQSITSLSDVVLAEFDMSKSEDDRRFISDFVSVKITSMLEEIAKKREVEWRSLSISRAEQFEQHAVDLRKAAKDTKKGAPCPPGFVKVNGNCVPI
jgi:hypothetical protein